MTPRRLRILLLYEAVYPDNIGGVETRNWELGRALGRRGHEVTLAGFCAPLPGEPPNVRVLPLGPSPRLYNAGGRRSTRAALRFAAAVARLDVGPYDVVETANMPYVHLLPLAVRCRLAGKPLLVSWYEYWAGYWRGYVGAAKAPVYRAIEWLTAQLGRAATASSRLTLERLAPRRHRRGTVELVPCGIEVEQVRAAAAAGGAAGSAMDGGGATDSEPAPPRVFAGRLLEHKRLDLLLAALPRVAAAVDATASAPVIGSSKTSTPATPAATHGAPLLTIFGEGPDRPRLEALAAKLGITARVRFRGHVATSEEVWRELGRARIAVQPSAREGFGLFPLEAMAAGLPVVHCESSESAVAELVRDGVEGVAAPADAPGLAAALAALLADEPRRARLATAARARAAEYDYDAIAAQFERVCLALLTGRRSAGSR
ncbi:MAG TPA: glycosyltransferase family 4 protein [Thermoanaerobaculia bacterium]|nr:glycosyltransferase family 4 protein [Thermoanaerobaculia bacterium]